MLVVNWKYIEKDVENDPKAQGKAPRVDENREASLRVRHPLNTSTQHPLIGIDIYREMF